MKTSQRILLAFTALLAVIPFIHIDFFYYSHVTSRIMLWGIAIIGIVCTAWYEARMNDMFKNNLISAAQHPVVLVYGLFVGWLFVRSSVVFSPDVWWGSLDRTDGLLFHSGWLIACVIMTAFTKSVAGVHEKLGQMFVGVATITTLVSGLIFLLFPLNPAESDLPRFAGSVGNPLYLAGALLLIPFFLTFVKNNYLRIGSLVTMVVALVATETRGAYLAVIVGAGAFCFFYERINLKFRIVLASFVSIIVIAAAVGFATDAISSVRFTTVQSRIALWKDGLKEFAHSPVIGYGVGEHVNAVDRGTLGLKSIFYNGISDTTHSAYIDLALQGGIIAVLLFIILIVVTIRSILRYDPWSATQRSLAAATLIAYCAFVATSFLITWIWIPFLLIIAPTLNKNVSGRFHKATLRVLVALSVVTVTSAVLLVAYTGYAGNHLNRVETAVGRSAFVMLPSGSLYIQKALPYAKDFFIAQLRLTMPSTERAIAPSYDRYIQQVKGDFVDLERMDYRHPQDDLVAATWLSQYVTSGLSENHQEPFEVSVRFQQHALAINPDRPQTYFQLADTYRELGRMNDALNTLKTFVERNPSWPEGHLFYGVMLDIAGNKIAADEQAQLALQLRPLEQWTLEHQEWLKEHLPKVE